MAGCIRSLSFAWKQPYRVNGVRQMTSATKAMATAAASQKKLWLITIPDTPDILAKRLEVRQRHLEAIAPDVDQGLFKVAGAVLEEHPSSKNDQLKINGSILIAQAETEEQVIKRMKEDIYTTSGVWDWKGFEIRPFKPAFIIPPEEPTT